MADDKRPPEKFSHVRVLWRSFVTYLGLLGTGQVIAGWSKPVEALRQHVFENSWELIPAFIAFYAVFMMYEVVSLHFGAELRRLRDAPEDPVLPFNEDGEH